MDSRLAQAGVGVEQIDAGLRSHMLSVYNYMGLALALTGLTAFVFAPVYYSYVMGTPLTWVLMLAPFAFILVLGVKARSMSASAVQLTFWAFAIAMGLSLSSIFLAFTGTSIARVFFITAGTFGAMSLYGYTTQRDLSKFGSFLFMGLIGIVIAMVVNIFIASSALHFAISVIGVLVFTGLTAWDTQRIKEEYYALDSAEVQTKGAVLGALNLYLNFINLFIMLLNLFGNRE
jgi:FtsH-binding integral membrane protein